MEESLLHDLGEEALDKIITEYRHVIQQGLPRPARLQDVIIVGAGMAGLTAAYLLRYAGHRVRILEASDGVGARIHTFRCFSGDLYAEAGAMRVLISKGAVCGGPRKSIALEQGEASKIVGLAFELIGDLGRERFLAVLEKSKQLAMHRQVVMRRFKQGQKGLLRLCSRFIDMDDAIGHVIDTEHLGDRCFDADAGFVHIANFDITLNFRPYRSKMGQVVVPWAKRRPSLSVSRATVVPMRRPLVMTIPSALIGPISGMTGRRVRP